MAPTAGTYCFRLLLTAGSRGAGLRRLRKTVAHQSHVDTAVLCATGGTSVLRNRIVLAQSDQENLVRGYVVLLRQVLDHGIGAALAELVVVISGAGRVGVSLDLNYVVLLVLELGGKV